MREPAKMRLPVRVSAFAGLVGLIVATPFLLVACGGGSASSQGASPTPIAGIAQTSNRSTGVSVDIKIVPGFRFDKSELTIPADTYVTITVNNTDDGVPHNFAVYWSKQDAEAGAPPLASTEICAGPCKRVVNLRLPAGQYFFRCDVHPQEMTGQLTVQ
jgi:plastocyanin